jgi:hypothetical protein
VSPSHAPIDVRTVGEWLRPLPGPDLVSAVYWKAAAEGRLLIQRCPSCGVRQFYPRALCTTCGGDPEWEEASGRGTVYTFTVIRRQGLEPFRDEVPYVVAMIALDEGPLVMGNVTGCPVDDVTIGMAVQAYVVEAAPDLGVPFWEPAGDGL